MKRFSVYALLLLMSLPALIAAQQANQQSAIPSNSQLVSIAGTTWVGTDSYGDYYEYHFQADGSLHYKSPTGFWKNGTWKQDGDSIYMERKNKFFEYQGRISGTHMEGNGWNVKGRKWTWAADSFQLTSIAGTTWVGSDSYGDYYEYHFQADGSLHYTSPTGLFWKNGTWKQDGDSIYMERKDMSFDYQDMEINNKFAEYQGRISGTHMEGKAWNKKGQKWTWAADSFQPASVAGTTWVGNDGDYLELHFQADGSLHYKSPNAMSGFLQLSNGTWKQDGDSIYMEINNKFAEYQGRISGTHMEGKAWNKKGQKWSWGAGKR